MAVPDSAGPLRLVVDTASTVPPFEQVRVGIAAAISSGELPAGTRLATVRQLAADLGLAANTVARAYRELEVDGLISTQGRRGTFVASTKLRTTPQELTGAAESFAAAARRLGLTRSEAVRLVEDAWSG